MLHTEEDREDLQDSGLLNVSEAQTGTVSVLHKVSCDILQVLR